METIQIKPIAHIHNDFTAKFGIPRQSGLVDQVVSKIIFTPEYRNADALRGLEGYSHLWLIWQFSMFQSDGWSPTVRPPRLGGNQRMGIFATRSPNRPNPLGLSSVKIEGIELSTPQGPILYVSGADLMDQTPIYDIKPYLPYTDSHPDAAGGFGFKEGEGTVEVHCPPQLLDLLPQEKRQGLLALLEQDPRPGYLDDPERIFGMEFGGFEIRFKVVQKTLEVLEICQK